MTKSMTAVRAPVTPRSFSWSYSRLKNFETCPSRYYHVDLVRDVPQEQTEELDRGDALHKAMYSRVTSGTKLPAQFVYMERWANILTKELHPLQIIQCELKLAVDKSMRPTGFMDKTTWCRVKVDYFKLLPRREKGRFLGHMVDYKTGRPKEDDTQLLVNAALLFAHYKDMDELRANYLWTEYNDTHSLTITRRGAEEAMEELLPRVTRLELAAINGAWEPTFNRLCKDYCPVRSCKYNGKAYTRA